MTDSLTYWAFCLAASVEMSACAQSSPVGDAVPTTQRHGITLPILAYDTITYSNGKKRQPAFSPQRISRSRYRNNVYSHGYILNENPAIAVEVFFNDADGDRKMSAGDIFTQAIENDHVIDQSGMTQSATAILERNDLLVLTRFNGVQITAIQQMAQGKAAYWRLVETAARATWPEPAAPQIRLTMPIVR